MSLMYRFRRWHIRSARAIAITLIATAALACTSMASAATYTVTNSNDSGPDSLRQAIINANASSASDIIEFNASTNGNPIVLQSPLPTLTDNSGNLTITGNGAANTIIDGAGQYRMFHAQDRNTWLLTVNSLTLRNGSAGADERGGAIRIQGGSNATLAINGVEFVDNYASQHGGAIEAQASITIDNSLFVGSQLSDYLLGSHIFCSGGSLTVRNTTFADSRYAPAPPNYPPQSAVALDAGCHGRFVNSTLHDWRAYNAVSAQNSTFSLANSFLRAFNAPFFVSGTGSIVLADTRNNVIQHGSTSHGGVDNGVNGNQVGPITRLMAPLADYGGPVRTFALLPGSPLINRGSSGIADAPATDARGISRVGAPDVGAFESRGFAMARVSGNAQSTQIGTAFANPLVVRVAANQAMEPVEGGLVEFTAPATGASASLATSPASVASDGRAQVTATANSTVGGLYIVIATVDDGASSGPSTTFALTNLAAPPALSINDVNQAEGNGGSTAFTFTVSLDQPAGPTGVTFDIATANGTAVAPGDYTAQSLTGQSIPANASNYSFTVLVNGDTTPEPAETFFVNVTNVTGATVADGQGMGTILNDDSGACGGFTFPYTLTASDNAARVTELRQAIECANANATDDVIDLDGHTLVLSDAPYSDAHADTALPFITSVLELRNGQLERDEDAPAFRLLLSDTSGTLTVRRMQLRGGSALGDGGAILALGSNRLTIRHSVFENNSATARGGAVAAHGISWIVMSDFSRNTAPDGAALAAFGMIGAVNNRFFANGDADSDSVLWSDLYAALIGNLFADNRLTDSGSSLMVFTSNTQVAEMRHMTIADNAVQGALLRIENGNTVQVRNSILWNNTSAGLGDLTPWYSLLPGAPAGGGNLDADPLFVATPGNYRLAAGSPAIDAADMSNSYPDSFDVDEDGDNTEFLPDLDLSPRPWDDPAVPNTGIGPQPFFDIGAYERQPQGTLPTLDIDDVSVNEGDSGTTNAVFTISLSAPAPLGGTAFDIATSNSTATTADNDYVAQSLTAVLIPAGESSTTFTVQVNGDTVAEADETFFVTVTNIVNAVAGDTQGVGTIINDDDPCAGFSFPYTLAGADNPARVVELRQAIECANANATDDIIDLAGQTLIFDTADANEPDNALPVVSSGITLLNGTLQRDSAAADFRLVAISGAGHLIGEALAFRNGRSSAGAAIYNAGTLTLRNASFFDNGDRALTAEGGAIFHGSTEALRIVDSVFEGNAAALGGAVFINAGDVWLRRSLLQGNQSDEGGALYSLSSTIRLFDNAFVANHALRGGAIKSFSARITGTRFDGNTADERAGAVYMESGFVDMFVSNSLFTGNQAPEGAVLFAADASTHLNNVTLSGHPAGAGSLLASAGDDIIVANSIVWGNNGRSLGTATVRHSLVEGGYPGGTNIIDLNPRFIDPADGDFRLASHSPAIDAGNNADVRFDSWWDVDDDGEMDEELDDLDGNPRRHDDTGVVDTGVGSAPLVDLGAYERQINSGAPGVTVDPTSGLLTSEAGGTASFNVVLDTQPNADVSIDLGSSDTTEGTVSPVSLTFTPANWNIAQTVTVTGVDDNEVDGDIAYTIVTVAAASTDANYNGLDPANVSVTNTDNDSAGITVSPTTGLVITEGMGPTGTSGVDQFSVVLNSQPAADVTIALSSSDATEGTASPASLTFTAANWNVAQLVDVLSVDDYEVDGDISFTIVTGAAVSADPNYNGVDPADVSVTNRDNDSAGITVNPTSGLTTTEAGGTATFTVVLDSQPSADVSIGLSSSDTTEGTVTPASLSFTAANWNIAQTVTVTGVDDNEVDGDIAYTIVTAAVVSSDTNYDGMDPADVAVTNMDDDVHTPLLVAFKSVSQIGTDSQPVIYEIVLSNIGEGDQVDDPVSHELSDLLPSELALVNASADAGNLSLDLPGNTVHWNGSIAAGATVTIQIEANVAITQAAIISNQASVHYDGDGDGSNDATTLSTDPAEPGTEVPTRFQFAGVAPAISPAMIPASSTLALFSMIALMMLAAGLALRTRRH